MTTEQHSRPGAAIALLVTAIVSGAFAGLVAASFIWVIDEGTKLVWSDLPEKIGVDPFGTWWMFVVPIVGGVLVGVGQMVLGNYPRPLDEAIATWKQGGHIEPAIAPKTALNSLAALVAGGPVGFEAALTGVLGGTATFIGARITKVGALVRQAWGAERIEHMPHTVRQLPYWLAAVSGLFTYHWLPFGEIDFGFRFTDFDGRLGFGGGIAVFGFSALVVIPAAWAVSMVVKAEHALYFKRSPIVAGVLGGVLFALLATPNSLVLFSGQQGIQGLVGTANGELFYVAIAKWAALVIALYAGWRGGPIFPTYISVAALALLVDQVVDVGPDIMIVAGIAAAGVVFVRGNVPMAVVLSLYPVQLTYASVILVACIGGALGLAVARALGALPRPPIEAAQPAGTIAAADPASNSTG